MARNDLRRQLAEQVAESIKKGARRPWSEARRRAPPRVPLPRDRAGRREAWPARL